MGKPDFSLANNFVVPVKIGSPTSLNIIPDPVAAVLKAGPTNFNAPENAVPSVPNFNLFLNTAAAYSLGLVMPSKLSSFVFSKVLSKIQN